MFTTTIDNTVRPYYIIYATTPIFHAPVSDVSPLTLLRLKFQKKLGPNYSLNNGYFLSGPLGLTNICFSFCSCKRFHPCMVHVIVVCLITVDAKHEPVSSTEAQACSPEALSANVSMGA